MIDKLFVTNDKDKRIQNPKSELPSDYWGWKAVEAESIPSQSQYSQPLTEQSDSLSDDERAAIKRQMLQRMMGETGGAMAPDEVESEQYSPEKKQMIKELGWQMNEFGSPVIPQGDIGQINEGIKVYQQGLPIDRRTEMILRVMTDLYDQK